MSETIQTKQCSRCKQIETVSEFYKNRSEKDGFDHQCKSCRKCYQQSAKGKIAIKRYKQTEKGKANAKRYNQTEKGKTTAQRYKQSKKGQIARRRYWQSKKGKATVHSYQQTEIYQFYLKSKKYKAVRRRYRQSEKAKEYNKQWHLRHPEYQRAISAVNKAVKNGKLPRTNTLPCHYCGEQAKHYHHHKGYEPKYKLDVIPICKGCHIKLHSAQPKSP